MVSPLGATGQEGFDEAVEDQFAHEGRKRAGDGKGKEAHDVPFMRCAECAR